MRGERLWRAFETRGGRCRVRLVGKGVSSVVCGLRLWPDSRLDWPASVLARLPQPLEAAGAGA